MSNEILHIENFAGIKNAEIELGAMNVFIGPQASGKSVCAKLFYFFKQCFATLAYQVASKRTKSAVSASHKDTFYKYFPSESWSNGAFTIRYSYRDLWIEVSRRSISSHTVKIEFSPAFDIQLTVARDTVKRELQLYDKGSEWMVRAMENLNYPIKIDWGEKSSLFNSNYFIPAGRSYLSTMNSNVFRFLVDDLEIDPFLVEFGSTYNSAHIRFSSQDSRSSQVSDHINSILCGKYQWDLPKNKDYIVMDDSRKVAIENCSSGQQETLPLVLGLLSLARSNKKAKANTVFIEEPEAHLYPTAQREVVHLIAATIDFVSEDSTSQCVMTTHSPYILTALNNLMYAGRIGENSPDKRKQVNKVIEETAWISPSKVRAYFFENGEVRSIIDPETQLVEATQLDQVSTDLAVEFDRLLDIEYAEVAV